MNDFDYFDDDDQPDDGDGHEDWEKHDPSIRGTDNPTVLSIMDELGIYHIDEFVVEIDSVPPENLRGGRFASIEEVIIHLYEIGVLSFSGVVRYDDLFGEAIPSDSK